MNKATIIKLNQLNQNFYQKTAQSFNDSRQYYWSGWYDLKQYLDALVKNKKEFRVLDLGCGNGRFGEFLFRDMRIHKTQYHGVDYSEKLLDLAHKRLTKIHVRFRLKKLDLVKALITGSLLNHFQKEEYDLIVGFGVLHHIPSLKLRQKLFKELSKLLAPSGMLATTSWQFAKEERFDHKVVAPKKINLKAKQLENNDYILDWKRGEEAYRYCHFTDENEIKQLYDGANTKLVDQFYADGKSGELNLYSVLIKK